jgi:hypothetical protein
MLDAPGVARFYRIGHITILDAARFANPCQKARAGRGPSPVPSLPIAARALEPRRSHKVAGRQTQVTSGRLLLYMSRMNLAPASYCFWFFSYPASLAEQGLRSI